MASHTEVAEGHVHKGEEQADLIQLVTAHEVDTHVDHLVIL